MKLILALGVLIAGASTAAQLGMNSQLRHSLGHGTFGSLVNFLVGTTALILLIVVARIPLPSAQAVAQTPSWAWFGGLCGAFLVTMSAVAGRELGAVYIAALLVTGQLCMSLVLDHFGWFGFPIRPFTITKLVGCALLLVSLILFKEG